MSKTVEEWRPVVGYEGLYEVSDWGNVRSDYKKDLKKLQKFSRTKYTFVTLFKGGKGKIFTIHRLVAEAFIPNPQNKSCVDHINTIRDDNRVENLRWCTHKENLNNSLTKEHLSKARIGKKASEETKEKLRKIGKTKIGNLNSFYGKHHTDKTKQKSSEKMQKLINENLEYKEQLIKQLREVSKRRFKPRYQIDPQNNQVVKLWDDYDEFKNSKFNIKCVRRCCEGGRKTYKGFIWKYESDYLLESVIQST